MIESVIRWSIHNRFMVILLSLILAVGGAYVMVRTPVDAIPDLSDVQVIVKTPFPGQAPQMVAPCMLGIQQDRLFEIGGSRLMVSQAHAGRSAAEPGQFVAGVDCQRLTESIDAFRILLL